MSKIKHENGKVIYVMRTGKTFVRSNMSLGFAQSFVKNGKDVEETDKRGYGMEICVDDKYFFPIEPEKAPRKKEATDEVVE
jgi:hypothetical protein